MTSDGSWRRIASSSSTRSGPGSSPSSLPASRGPGGACAGRRPAGRPGMREREQAPPPLAQGLLGDQRLGLGEHLAVAPGAQRGLGMQVLGVEAQLVESRRLDRARAPTRRGRRSGAPRHSASASPMTRPPGPARRAAAAREPARPAARTEGVELVAVEHRAGSRGEVSIAAGASDLRSRTMQPCTTLVHDAGGSRPRAHRPAPSALTATPGLTTRAWSTTRSRRPSGGHRSIHLEWAQHRDTHETTVDPFRNDVNRRVTAVIPPPHPGGTALCQKGIRASRLTHRAGK